MALRRVVSLVLMFVMTAGAAASTYNGNVEYTVGSGTKQAFIAVDFDISNSFVFAYRWDGIATSWDALHSIDLAGALNINATNYGTEWGMFINDLSYPGGAKYNYGSGVNTGWTYYTGNNESWSTPAVGVSFNNLNSGDWNSLVWTNYDDYWMPIRQPGQQPVPEPATITLLMFGGLILARRKRMNTRL